MPRSISKIGQFAFGFPKWSFKHHRRRTQRERLDDARPIMAKGILIFINHKHQMGKKTKQNLFF